jgi:diguanylate cyclase (GGDEF)-like protein/PAS domain S-box-containing protein
MTSATSNVVYLRPRAWSATERAGQAGLLSRLPGGTSLAAAGRVATARWAGSVEYADAEDRGESPAHFRDLFERSPVCLLVMGLDGLVRRANATATALLSDARAGLAGTHLFDLCDPLSRPDLQAHLQRFAAGAIVDSCEIEVMAGTEGPVPMSIMTLNVGDCAEGPLRSALFDLSGQRELEAGLSLAASVVENTSQGVIVTDDRHRIIAVNPAFSAISGYTAGEVIGTIPAVFQTDPEHAPLAEQVHLGLRVRGYWQGEVWNRRKGGESYPEWVSVNEIPDLDDAPPRYVCLISDMTSQEESRRELMKLAHYDDLTGLPNRPNLLGRLNRALSDGRRDDHPVALLFLDLDGFKGVNDTFGHAVGDRLLRFVADRLRCAVRSTDIVARLSGDEFAVLLPNLKNGQAAASIAHKVLEVLSQHAFHEQGREIYVGASIGIALFPKDADTAEDLLHCADQAMYAAKGAGGIGYRCYQAAGDARPRDGHRLEAALRLALGHKELRLYYQPRVSLRDFRVLACEALLHWEPHPAAPVAPEVFVPLAEKTGLIVPFEHWALRAITAQRRRWSIPGRPPVPIAVHLSSVHLHPAHLERLLRRLTSDAGPASTALEVVLDVAVVNECPERARSAFAQIQGLGTTIALNHFGVGPTPLRGLKALPLGQVTLDRSLVQDLDTDPDAVKVTAAMIALAHALGLQVVADGVTRNVQLQVLRAQGCDAAQGPLFSPPLPADALNDLLTQSSGDYNSGGARAPSLMQALAGAWSRGLARLRGSADDARPP